MGTITFTFVQQSDDNVLEIKNLCVSNYSYTANNACFGLKETLSIQPPFTNWKEIHT